MTREIHRLLQDIERAYYDGATFDALCERIDQSVRLIAALDATDPIRQVCEAFAPMLWGGASGSEIAPKAVQAALAGPDASAHLRSWAGIGRAILAHRAAA